MGCWGPGLMENDTAADAAATYLGKRLPAPGRVTKLLRSVLDNYGRLAASREGLQAFPNGVGHRR